MASEALMNLVKHGDDKNPQLIVNLTDNIIELQVLSKGQLNLPDNLEDHFGLKNMQERAAKYNGSAKIFSPAPNRVKVEARFEIEREDK